MAHVLMAAYTNYRRDPRVRREAEALVDQGHKVTFLAKRQPGEPVVETLDGVTVKKLPGLSNPRTSAIFYMLDYGVFFFFLLLHLTFFPRRYQLIHINNMPDFLVFATLMPKLLGTPVIHDVHDLMPELYTEKFGVGNHHWMIRLLMLQERWAGRLASAVLTVEEKLRDILADRGIPKSKIFVLMNLPDDRIFKATPKCGKQGMHEPFVMVYHGTLARRLGLDVAIHAVAIARATIPRIELRIIGAGEERESLIDLRDRLGLTDEVSFSDGFVPVGDIPDMIADADVGVVPIRKSSGTDIMLPTKLLEYVALGIPCIVPRTGTVCRYFDDEMVEFFEAESIDGLAEAMLSMGLDPDKRRSKALQASRRFGDKYSWKIHKRVYTSLVDSLLP